MTGWRTGCADLSLDPAPRVARHLGAPRRDPTACQGPVFRRSSGSEFPRYVQLVQAAQGRRGPRSRARSLCAAPPVASRSSRPPCDRHDAGSSGCIPVTAKVTRWTSSLRSCRSRTNCGPGARRDEFESTLLMTARTRPQHVSPRQGAPGTRLVTNESIHRPSAFDDNGDASVCKERQDLDDVTDRHARWPLVRSAVERTDGTVGHEETDPFLLPLDAGNNRAEVDPACAVRPHLRLLARARPLIRFLQKPAVDGDECQTVFAAEHRVRNDCRKVQTASGVVVDLVQRSRKVDPVPLIAAPVRWLSHVEYQHGHMLSLHRCCAGLTCPGGGLPHRDECRGGVRKQLVDRIPTCGRGCVRAQSVLRIGALGLPRYRQLTTAKELSAQYTSIVGDVRVIDNHYTANVVFGVPTGRRLPNPPETWGHVDRVREAVWERHHRALLAGDVVRVHDRHHQFGRIEPRRAVPPNR